MGLFAQALRPVTQARVPGALTVAPWQVGRPASPQGSYEAFARRGYAGNEIVYSAIKLIATSASEPHLIGRRLRRNRPQVRAAAQMLRAMGVPNRAGAMAVNAMLVQNGFVEELPHHPLVQLLNRPNPLSSRGQFWRTITMDKCLAGNAFALKARGPYGNVMELWRLRPDRVRIIPDRSGIGGYEYRVGDHVQEFAASDVMHFKDPNPLDDFYGMPPLLPLMERVDIDNYMRSFLAQFFERGGNGPAAVLAVKNKLKPGMREEIQQRLKQQFSPLGGWHATLVLEEAEASYTELGLDRGLRDALPKEINALNEARLAMVFGIPGSILGLLIGYESSSYANRRQDWQVLWDVKMTPELSDMDDVLNLHLTPEFAGIDEVEFDLSDIRALQEDVEALQERARKNVAAGLWSQEEGRAYTGVSIKPEPGSTFFLPAGIEARPFERLTEQPEPPPAEGLMAPEAQARLAELLAGNLPAGAAD